MLQAAILARRDVCMQEQQLIQQNNPTNRRKRISQKTTYYMNILHTQHTRELILTKQRIWFFDANYKRN